MARTLLSIVIPVYNEVESIPEFLNEVSRVVLELEYDFEFIFAADPSNDGTEQLLREINQQDPRVKMILMSRKFGQPACSMAGLHYSRGAAAVVMDVDLQDPPSVIPEMIHRWENGALIVLAQRRTRTGESPLRRFIAHTGYSFLNRFADPQIPRDTGDFRLLDRTIIEKLELFPEKTSFFRGIVALVGYDNDVVYFDRPDRLLGNSKYNRFFGSLKIGFGGVVSYSTVLLSLSTMLGIFISTVAILIGCAYVAAKIAGMQFPIGNPTVVFAVLMTGGINLFSVGILGMYVASIHEEVKSRPRYIAKELTGIETSD